MTKILINERYDVEEADANKSFGKGEKREDYADAWKDTGNVILVGMAGSGKRELARLLADRTGLDVAVPDNASGAAASLEQGKGIVVLSESLVEDEAVRPLIHGAGKVFYLMADSRTLTSRQVDSGNAEDDRELWQDVSARLAGMEPVFYSVLHFILQAVKSPDNLVDDAMEKIGF